MCCQYEHWLWDWRRKKPEQKRQTSQTEKPSKELKRTKNKTDLGRSPPALSGGISGDEWKTLSGQYKVIQ